MVDEVRKEDPYWWLEQPATFCDHFALQLWESAGVVRFAFGEYTKKGGPHLYRTGIAMPISDAKSLVRVLRRAIEQAEKGLDEEDEEDDENDENPSPPDAG